MMHGYFNSLAWPKDYFIVGAKDSILATCDQKERGIFLSAY